MWFWKIVDIIINEIMNDRSFTYDILTLAACGCCLCWGAIYSALSFVAKKIRLFTNLKEKHPKGFDRCITFISAAFVICLVIFLMVGDIIYRARTGKGGYTR